MPRKPWGSLSREERQVIVDRLNSGESAGHISEELGCTPGSLRKSVWRFKRLIADNRESRSSPTPRVDRGSFDQYWDLYNELIGREEKRDPLEDREEEYSDKRTVAVIGDIHSRPNVDILSRVVELNPDLIVYNGDVFDCFSMSRFPKDHVIPIADEIAEIRAVFENMHKKCTNLKRQLVVEGNHDRRALKYFQERIEPQFLPLVQWNLLELASQSIPNIEVVKNTYQYRSPTGTVVDGTLNNVFIAHLGDALIGHAEVARKYDTRTVHALAEWAVIWHRQLNFELPRLVVQGHIHGAGTSYYQGGHMLLIEGGYSGTMEGLQYVMQDAKIGYRPPVPGFVQFEQKELNGAWRTSVESAKFIVV